MFFMFGLMYPLVVLALVAWLSYAIWVAVTLPRRAVKQPACERCRYPVEGLGSLNCPECGADLRRIGIITRAMEVRRRGHLPGALVAWSLLCLMVGLFARGFIFSTFMTSAPTSAGTTTTSQTHTLSPNSGAYKSVEIAATQVVWLPNGSLSNTVVLTLTSGDDSVATMKVTGPTLQFQWLGSDGTLRQGRGLSPADVRMWMRSLGIDASAPVVLGEADGICNVAADLATGGRGVLASVQDLGGFSVSSGTLAMTTTSQSIAGGLFLSREHATILLGGLALWILTWAYGFFLIARRRRRLQREHAPVQSG